uniref:Uncharacterized protein n=1 Tax=Chelonoidis abingdonii TaxID=106734 RepID=A0A8C0QS35_CHEAB
CSDGMYEVAFKATSAEAKETVHRGSIMSALSLDLIFILFRYEDTWAALHKGAKECAKAGEVRKKNYIC